MSNHHPVVFLIFAFNSLAGEIVIKNSFIPSNNYSLLEKQNKFGFRKKYVKRKFKDFLSTNFCQYSEFSYNENTKSRYKIICNSTYPCIKNKNENETTFRISLDSSYVKEYLKNEVTNKIKDKSEIEKILNKNIYNNENIINYRSIINNDSNLEIERNIGIDMTAFDDKNQLDIDSSNNIYLEKLNIMIIIHSIIYFGKLSSGIYLSNKGRFSYVNLKINSYQTMASLLQMDNYYIMTIYFYAHDHLIKISTVYLPFSEYKKVNKKNNRKNNNKNNDINNDSNITEIIDKKFYCFYYHKQVEMSDDVPTQKTVNTFNIMILGSFQKENLDLTLNFKFLGNKSKIMYSISSEDIVVWVPVTAIITSCFIFLSAIREQKYKNPHVQQYGYNPWNLLQN
ncbi:hypothetical protein U3516DRAFT_746611 [Neocallimastix sp. 'constans']